MRSPSRVGPPSPGLGRDVRHHVARSLEHRDAQLTKLAADPANGIEAILDQKQVAALGDVPQASFVVTLNPGYTAGASLTGALVRESPLKGTHGYNPQTTPEMRASFFATGPGIQAGKDLGIIDMRRIAPTIAGLLQVSLPTATQPVLDLH